MRKVFERPQSPEVETLRGEKTLTHNNSSEHLHYSSYYSEWSRKVIELAYAPDIARGNYTFENTGT